jgi:hypothetical protein
MSCSYLTARSGYCSCTRSQQERRSPEIYFDGFERKSKMISKKKAMRTSPGEELGRKLLQSVREMKAKKRGRVTAVEVNEVAQGTVQ